MQTPYPCPKSLGEMQSTSHGFYCGDCKKHLIDTRNPNAPAPVKGDCIITEEPQERYFSLNKTYKFALAIFIVMAGTLITDNSAYAGHLIGKLDALRENILQYDSTTFYFNGEVCDLKGKPIKPVKVTVELENGEKINEVNLYSSRNHSNYHFQIHERYKNTKMMITLEYYGQTKTIEVFCKGEETQIPKVEFKRSRKDRYNKKRYKNVRFVGKF